MYAVNFSYQETILVHPTRRQSFVGKSESTFYNMWDLILWGEEITIDKPINKGDHRFSAWESRALSRRQFFARKISKLKISLPRK